MISNWIDINEVQPIKIEKSTLKKLNLSIDDFIVLYVEILVLKEQK